MSGIVGVNSGRDSGTVGTVDSSVEDNAIDETKLKDALIGDFTAATVTASDTFLHGDATDSGNTKKDTVAGIFDAFDGQLPFPASQDASADANTLDDYEQGTWTAELSDGTNGATPTATGTYTKIGRLVCASAFVSPSSLGSASGSAQIKGLPFTSANDSQYHSASIGFVARFDSIAVGENILGHMPPNTTRVELYIHDAAEGVTGLTCAEFSANGQLMITINYTSA